jgi:hypothetical protein
MNNTTGERKPLNHFRLHVQCPDTLNGKALTEVMFMHASFANGQPTQWWQAQAKSAGSRRINPRTVPDPIHPSSDDKPTLKKRQRMSTERHETSRDNKLLVRVEHSQPVGALQSVCGTRRRRQASLRAFCRLEDHQEFEKTRVAPRAGDSVDQLA